MNFVRKEVRDLITINEKIQSALLNGDPMTDDEATLIRQCASELLQKIPAPQGWRPVMPHVDGQHERETETPGRP